MRHVHQGLPGQSHQPVFLAMYKERFYRSQFGRDLVTHELKIGQTDLAVCLPAGIWQGEAAWGAEALCRRLRGDLELFCAAEPVFLTTHNPYRPGASAPGIAVKMAIAATAANVGPMAAVAGAFAQEIGEFLLAFSPDVIVENGGDIFIATTQPRIVGVFAGASPFSGKIGLKIAARRRLGVCTSSGTVGPSFSYGLADAAVIIAGDAFLADAAATAAGNLVRDEKDLQKAADHAMGIEGVLGALLIKGDKLAARGEIELTPL